MGETQKATELAEVAGAARRRVPRRAFECPVGVLLHGNYFMERSYQVGEGGMMISCHLPITEGTQIVLSFVLQSGSMIMVRGIVRSTLKAEGRLPQRFGIEFLNLGFNFKREIRNFVAAATRVDGHMA